MISKNGDAIFSAQRTPFSGRIWRIRALLTTNDKMLRAVKQAIFGINSASYDLNGFNGAERWKDLNGLNKRFLIRLQIRQRRNHFVSH